MAAFFALHAQTPAQSTAAAAVPSWFVRCAGQNGTCPVYGQARVIFGSASGLLPETGGSFVSQTFSNSVLCSDIVFGDPDPGNPKACWYGPPDGLGSGQILGAGGSNYPFSVQNYGVWDGNERVLVGTYHLDPTIVEAQLRQLYKSGQRKVTLIIWYMPFLDSNTPLAGQASQWPDVWVAWLNSSGGHLSTQTQQNLQAICTLVQQIGFNQLTVRFGPIGSTANPTLWGATWNEAAFEQDEAFVFNTRQLVETSMASSGITRMYDLGIELAGIPHTLNTNGATYADGQSPAWTARMWSDYVRLYGKADSYGFSVAYLYSYLTTAIAEFDRAGTRPLTYAFDTSFGTDVWSIYQELVAANEQAKPVIFQEVGYDDPVQMQGIQTELQHVPLTITSVSQWPVNTTGSNGDGMAPPANYGAYGGITGASGTIVGYPCTLTNGASTCTTNVSWATSNTNNVVLYVNGVAATNASNITTTLTGTATVSLGLPTTTLQLVSPDGILDSETMTAQDTKAPQISLAGLGGPNNQTIWGVGSNLSSGCAVQLYDPQGTYLQTLTTASCTPTSLSFALPATISTNYASVMFTASNPGSSTSVPYRLTIQAVPTLSRAGLGGTTNQNIWAIGTNFSITCSASLYDPNNPGGAALTTIGGINCAPNSMNFALPAYLQQKYLVLGLTITNLDGQTSGQVLLRTSGL